MKHTAIPESTRKAAVAIERKNKGFIGCNAPVPESAIEAITHGERGTYKPGLKCWVIGGDARTVFLGDSHTETTLPEFALVLESGSRFFGQFNRDFVFA